MIEIQTEADNLILKYLPYNSIDWLIEKFEQDGTIHISKIFSLTKDKIYRNVMLNEDDNEVLFVIGKLANDYWQIDRSSLGIDHEVFIYKDYSIAPSTFQSPTGLSVFKEIFKVLNEDIWIGGTNTSALDVDVFDALIGRFPTETELNHYISARVSSVMKDYFDSAKDFEKRYEEYIERKRQRLAVAKGGRQKTTNIRTFYKDNELDKYSEIYGILTGMMDDPEKYTEKEWQEAIIDILLLLYPKYVCVLENVKIKDCYANKNRYLDYLFIDTNGNTDIVEIKKPFAECLLRRRQYRNNYIPMTELSGAIMQIEKYIFYMNKWGLGGEKTLTKQYKSKLPSNLEIRITNPKGIVIMGQSKQFNSDQMSDFEIIKRKYNNVIDVLSYDDLIERIERLIQCINRI